MISSWRIGSICGIPLFLNPLWFGSLGLFAFLFSTIDWEADADWSWIAGASLALLLFGSVLLHELGHSLVAQSQGIVVNSITLFPLGGIASIAQESKTPQQAFWVAIAGPTVSFVLFLVMFVVSWFLPESLPKSVLSYLAWINLVLALFNLLPGLPLDGGQVLKAAIWQITGSRMQAVRWAARCGEGLGWLAIGLGLAGFIGFVLQFNFLWLVILGWFGVRRARSYRQSTWLQETLLALPVTAAMQHQFQTVNVDHPLAAFVAQALMVSPDPTSTPTPGRAIDPTSSKPPGSDPGAMQPNASELILRQPMPVSSTPIDSTPIYYAEAQGCYVGLVDLNQLAAIERSQWEILTVRSITQPLETLPTIADTASVATAIHQLETEGDRNLIVMTADQRMVGVIDRSSIVQAVAEALNLVVPPAVLEQIQTVGQFPADLPLQTVAEDALR
ncbi:MAG: site-2 protease family protein [Elainella sp. Prado103]|jgi:Zn-dependent protease|nr:site-2 protease family protein [Elainella sp. Prado103]